LGHLDQKRQHIRSTKNNHQPALIPDNGTNRQRLRRSTSSTNGSTRTLCLRLSTRGTTAGNRTALLRPNRSLPHRFISRIQVHHGGVRL
jgi:hypothetical protein